jgi:protein-disulfide isomerase
MSIFRSPTAWIVIPASSLILFIAATSYLTSNTQKSVENYEYIPAVGDVPFRKSRSGQTVVFIGSYTCSHCKNFYEGTFQEIVSKVDADVIYRHVWPTSKTQQSAALLTACSEDEKEPEVINAFYTRQEDLIDATSIDVLYDIAGISDEDIPNFAACAEAIDEDMLAGQRLSAERFDIKGTPTIVVDGKVFVGNHSLDELGLH